MLGKKAPPGASTSDDAFFHDIETLSKALSLESSASSKPRFSAPTKSSSHKSKDKKLPSNASSSSSSFWNWKPLRALSHIRNNHRRLDVLFSLHVHSVRNLPPPLDDAASLVVFWKRTTDPSAAASSTRPAPAHRGAAHFDDVEPLVHRCSVYYSASSSSRGGSGGGASAKYEPRHFVIWAAAEHAPALDLGRHLVDLTRVLPLTLDQILEENVEGKWTTSFKLSGKAKGATLNVSFGYSLFSGSVEPEKKSLDLLKQRSEKRTSSVPLPHQGNGLASRAVDDVRVLHEVPPSSITELTSITTSEKFEDEQVGVVLEDEFSEEEDKLLDMKKNAVEEFEKPELTLVHHGVENIEMHLEKVHEVVDKVLDLAEFANESNLKFESYDENEVDKLKMKSCMMLEPVKENLGSEDSQFKVVEKGVEIVEVMEKIENEVAKETTASSSEELIAELDNTQLVLSSRSHGLEGNSLVESHLIQDLSNDLDESSSMVSYSATQDFDIALSGLSVLESLPETPLLDDKSSADSCDSEFRSNGKGGRLKSKSLSSNDEVVASEFLSMLGIEHSPFGLSSDSDPDSPRERLWRQFEKEALANGDIFGLDIETHNEEPMDNGNLYGFDNQVENELEVAGFSDDFDLASLLSEVEEELQKATEAMNSKSRAKMLEDAETEVLMREFGLNEKAFQQSPPGSRGGFGSPIDILPEEPMELPPLGEGLGPFIQTKDGGFLRSMSPYLFRNANSNGSLVMQVSNPVVVPAEMGSGVMEVLQRLASVGIEKLSMQASKLMPLEDISGKTMQQVTWEAGSSVVGYESQEALQNNTDAMADALASGRRKKAKGLDLGSANSGGVGSEYVSLEDLAPLAMDQIEALSVEGLRIQSGMSDEEAPSNISALTMGDMSALEGKGRPNNNGSLGLQGAAGLQLLDVKDNGEEVDGLMGLSLTLDEWMRLDSGIIDEDGQISDRTAKILAAHHASSSELISGSWKGVKGGGRSSGKRWGLLGNNFTVALMVQLRDPLRNYEPVGTPMLSLIQVERVFVPPKPKIYHAVPEKDHREEGDKPATETEQSSKEEKNEEVEAVPQFKIAEVHVAGLRTEPCNKKVWGNQMQQQSGSRWLLANGMGKNNKHPLMKSKGLIKPSLTTTSGDGLWSISSQNNSFGAKWKEKAGWNTHIRNPDITLPNKNIKFR